MKALQSFKMFGTTQPTSVTSQKTYIVTSGITRNNKMCVRYLQNRGSKSFRHKSTVQPWTHAHRCTTIQHNLGLISNLMHKILVYLHIIYLLKSSTCFEHYPAHLQEVYVVTVYICSLWYRHCLQVTVLCTG